MLRHSPAVDEPILPPIGPQSAIRDFARAVTLDARFSAAYRGRAEAKVTVERYDEAIEDFSRAIAFEARSAAVSTCCGAPPIWTPATPHPRSRTSPPPSN